MQITDTQLAMHATHASLARTTRTETLRAWQGSVRPDFEGSTPAQPPSAEVTLSASGRTLAAEESEAETALDPRFSMLKVMIEYLTGRSLRIFDMSTLRAEEALPAPTPSATPAPPRAGFGVEYDLHTSREEQETTTFAVEGVVHTVDNKEISFRLELTMQRRYHEELNLSLRLGDAVRKDPLVINFDGMAAQLSGQTFRFDLDEDGKTEAMARLTGSSAYLAMDRNSNGRIDSGSELFGPQSNHGFAELAALDEDGNGWIDAGDAGFTRLRIWQPDAEGRGRLGDLASVGIGALSLAHIATPFELRGTSQEDLGAIRDTGLFLYADGRAGTLQEVDLSV